MAVASLCALWVVLLVGGAFLLFAWDVVASTSNEDASAGNVVGDSVADFSCDCLCLCVLRWTWQVCCSKSLEDGFRALCDGGGMGADTGMSVASLADAERISCLFTPPFPVDCHSQSGRARMGGSADGQFIFGFDRLLVGGGVLCTDCHRRPEASFPTCGGLCFRRTMRWTM